MTSIRRTMNARHEPIKQWCMPSMNRLCWVIFNWDRMHHAVNASHCWVCSSRLCVSVGLHRGWWALFSQFVFFSLFVVVDVSVRSHMTCHWSLVCIRIHAVCTSLGCCIFAPVFLVLYIPNLCELTHLFMDVAICQSKLAATHLLTRPR